MLQILQFQRYELRQNTTIKEMLMSNWILLNCQTLTSFTNFQQSIRGRLRKWRQIHKQTTENCQISNLEITFNRISFK